MAGRDILLTVQAKVEVGRSDINEPVYGWQNKGTVWAQRADLSDVESVAAGQEAGARLSQFTMRSNAMTRAITSDDRLHRVLTGDVWKVTGMIEAAKGRRKSVVVTGIQRSDG